VITGSVGFLSDALEPGVNLVAAVVALRVAARPRDAMIFVAATAIIWSSVERLMSPAPLVQPGLGLALSTAAAGVNLVVGLTLQRVGRRHRSISLIADGKHLMTDVHACWPSTRPVK